MSRLLWLAVGICSNKRGLVGQVDNPFVGAYSYLVEFLCVSLLREGVKGGGGGVCAFFVTRGRFSTYCAASVRPLNVIPEPEG